MELRQLVYFLAVAETLHFGKAARGLHMAEQPLSHQIKKLEAELGFRLFERTTRTVRLTEAGEMLREGALRSLAMLEESVERSRRVAKGLGGVIRIGYEAATVHSIFPEVIGRFRALYPDVKVVLAERVQASARDFEEDRFDACVVTKYSDMPEGVDYIPLKRDSVYVAFPKGHALADRESVRVADLVGERVVGYQGFSATEAAQFIESLARRESFSFKVSQEADSYMSVLGLVATGMGITFVIGAMRDLLADRVAYVPLAEPRIDVTSGIAWKAGQASTAIENLLNMASKMRL